MAKAERLSDGRIWVIRDDTSTLIITPAEAQAIEAASQGRRAEVQPIPLKRDPNLAVAAHLGRHSALGARLASETEQGFHGASALSVNETPKD